MMKGKRTIVAISKLRQNTGQLAGVNQNPRKWSHERAEKLRKSLQRDPQFLDFKPLWVYPYTDKREGDLYCVIGGNFRLETLAGMGVESCPCLVLPEETTTDELNRLILLDNTEFGENDNDLLANFDEDLLNDYDISLDDVQLPDDGKQPNEHKDISANVGELFQIAIDCENEREQERIYNELKDKYVCRVLTL